MLLEKCNAIFREAAAVLCACLPVAAVLLPSLPSRADTLPNGDVVKVSVMGITVAENATNLANANNTTSSSTAGFDSEWDWGTISNLFDDDGTNRFMSSCYLDIDLGDPNTDGRATDVVVKLTPDLSQTNWFREYNLPNTIYVFGSSDKDHFSLIRYFDTKTLDDLTERETTTPDPFYTASFNIENYRYIRISANEACDPAGWNFLNLSGLAVYNAKDVSVTSDVFALRKLGSEGIQTFDKLLSVTSADENTTATAKISTNAPQTVDSYYNGDETVADVALSNLVDGYSGTFFHSTWYAPDSTSAPAERHYLQVDMGEAKEKFAIYMSPRDAGSSGKPNLMPSHYLLYGTSDETKASDSKTGWESSWTMLLDVEDTRGETYFSGTLWLKDGIRYLRLVSEESYPDNEYVKYQSYVDFPESSPRHQPYFCLSEFQVCVPQNAELVSVTTDNGQTQYYEVTTLSNDTKVASYTQKLPADANSSTTDVAIQETITVNGTSLDVTSISNTAFTGTNVEKVTIPKSITSIGSGTFMNTERLTSINVDEDNETYSDYDSTLLESNSILYDGKTLLVYPEAKEGKTFTLPDDIIAIDQFAFYEAQNLEEIDLSQTGRTGTDSLVIAQNAFQKAQALKTITIPTHVKSVGAGAFESCPKLVSAFVYGKNLGDYCFRNDAALDTLDFYYDDEYAIKKAGGTFNMYKTTHGNTTSIGKKAFYNCTSLTGTLDIPRSIKSIGEYAFYGCKGIETVCNRSSESAVAGNCYSGMSGLTTIYLYSPNTKTINNMIIRN